MLESNYLVLRMDIHLHEVQKRPFMMDLLSQNIFERFIEIKEMQREIASITF